MPTPWIDIEDSSGNRLGSGPIVTSDEYSFSPRLDKAGEFSFSMPASDPRAALIYPITTANVKRTAVCRIMLNGSEVELGAGIIDNVQVEFPPSGPPILNVSGSDLLGELSNRLVFDLDNSEPDQVSPNMVYEESVGAYGHLANTYDGYPPDTPVTFETITLTAANEYLLIGSVLPFRAVNFTMGTQKNAQTSSNGFGYSKSDASFSELVELTDTISSGGAPFAQSGTITFDRPIAWKKATINGQGPYYWVRFDPDAGLDTIDIEEITLDVDVATTDDLTNIATFFPSGWTFNTVDWYDETAAGTFMRFSNESALAALITTGVLSDEHFRRGPGRTIQWLRDEQPDSGIRLVMSSGPARSGDNEKVAQIVALKDLQDTHEYYTRIYPKGAGLAEAQADLSLADMTIPAGYTMVTSANGGYIKSDTADAANSIEKVVTFKEIGAADNRAIFDRSVANQLAAVALADIQKHVVIPEFIQVEVVGLDEIILPGCTVHVEFRKIRSGVVVREIDGPFVILEPKTVIGSNSIATTQLKLASVPRWPVSDKDAVITAIHALSVGQQHSQPIDALTVSD